MRDHVVCVCVCEELCVFVGCCLSIMIVVIGGWVVVDWRRKGQVMKVLTKPRRDRGSPTLLRAKGLEWIGGVGGCLGRMMCWHIFVSYFGVICRLILIDVVDIYIYVF